MNNKHSAVKYIRTFLLSALAVLVFVAASVIVVDPFFHYHKPLENFPYVVDNQLSQNPGMAKHFEYDSVIIGSSMTVNFDTDDFREHLGLNTIKLCYSGAYPKDDANIMEVVQESVRRTGQDVTDGTVPMSPQRSDTGDSPPVTSVEAKEVVSGSAESAADSTRNIRAAYPDEGKRNRSAEPVHNGAALKAVFLPMDLPVMTGDVDEVKYPRPEYLYDTNPFNDVKYVLNKDVFLQYVVRPVLNPNPTDLSYVYASWWTDEYYNAEAVLSAHAFPEAVNEPLPKDALIERTQANLEANIDPFIEANPETTFYFFYPPYSILYWENVCIENRFEAVLYQTEYVTKHLLQYDNVRVFFFQDMEAVVTDLNNYADYSHYHPRVNAYMTECFATGAHEITSEDDLANHVNAVREMVASYERLQR
ncbi:MAG: hypothetical protein IJR58_09110 [Lachnospiraceae bacterium]|nr:hypothetical protein [Lachnospiraceae bacterium]